MRDAFFARFPSGAFPRAHAGLMSVTVPVVQIRIMRMPVRQRRMTVAVGVRIARWSGRAVLVLVMRVVGVAVLVVQRRVDVVMIMPFR